MSFDPGRPIVGDEVSCTVTITTEEPGCMSPEKTTDATNKTITSWTVKPAETASITAAGVMTAAEPGTYTVTARGPGSLVASGKVTVAADEGAEPPDADGQEVEGGLRFSEVTGSGLAYHMDAVYKTPIEYGDDGTAWGSGEYTYSEPYGSQTLKTRDTVKIRGTYDVAKGVLEGTYVYKMDGTSTGGGSDTMTHRARLQGRIYAQVDQEGDGRTLTGWLRGTYVVGSSVGGSDLGTEKSQAEWRIVLVPSP
jgi:hypothetical protein